MARDYAAEYAARQARARREGWSSYWEARQGRRLIARQDAQLRAADVSAGRREQRERQLASILKGGGAERRRLWREGQAALRRKDHDEADRIARQLGYRRTKTRGPASAIFFYH